MTNKNFHIAYIGIIFLLVAYIIYINTRFEYYINASEKEFIDYFKEIALGSEYGGTKEILKWNQPLIIKVVKDDEYKQQMAFLSETMNYLNAIQPENLQLRFAEDNEKYNTTIYLSHLSNLKKLAPGLHKRVDNNSIGYFTYWTAKSNIHTVRIFINTDKNMSFQKNAILEELVQALGLGNDSEMYVNSVFYQKKYTKNIRCHKLSKLDEQIIRVLYDDKLKGGENRLELESKVKRIVR